MNFKNLKSVWIKNELQTIITTADVIDKSVKLLFREWIRMDKKAENMMDKTTQKNSTSKTTTNKNSEMNMNRTEFAQEYNLNTDKKSKNCNTNKTNRNSNSNKNP